MRKAGASATLGVVGGLLECEGTAHVGVGALEVGGSFACRLGSRASGLDALVYGTRGWAAAVLGVGCQRGGFRFGSLRLVYEVRDGLLQPGELPCERRGGHVAVGPVGPRWRCRG